MNSPARELDFCCPLCQSDLSEHADRFHCGVCGKTYPVVEGIPDFRVYPDPYIDCVNDHRKARLLLRIAREKGCAGLEALVRLYWKITPAVPPARAERYIRAVCAAEERGAHGLDVLRRRARLPGRPLRFLEIGCGTGGLLAAAAATGGFELVTGVDIAFRWLVIARERLVQRGLSARLVCACADHLPFRSGQFDVAAGESVIEHVSCQEGALREARRMLNRDGVLTLRTVNRFSLACEPHVRVWGVGFLPRRWMEGYVRAIRGIPYRQHRLLSRFELRRLLDTAGFQDVRFYLPEVSGAEAAGFSRLERLLLRAYETTAALPGMGAILSVVGPSIEVVARAPAASGRNGTDSPDPPGRAMK